MGDCRKQLRRDERRTPRYLTFSCQKRLQLLGTPEWRDEFARVLAAARERCGFQLVAWVAMPEHVHLILVPHPEAPVPKVLRAIKQPIAQSALRRWRSANAPILDQLRIADGRHRYWQAGGGFDRNVRDADELAREVEYIHHNPVTRGLVERPIDWAWSSARWRAGHQDGQIPIDNIHW